MELPSEPSVIGEPLEVMKLKTFYRPDVSGKTKQEILRTWQRVKNTRKLTQANLAKALGISQGAVSKLLNNHETHPWTIIHVQKFCDFCGVSVYEVVDSDFLILFESLKPPETHTNQNFLEECLGSLANYYSEGGLSVNRAQLLNLAVKLSIKLENTRPDEKMMLRETEKLVLEQALSQQTNVE